MFLVAAGNTARLTKLSVSRVCLCDTSRKDGTEVAVRITWDGEGKRR